MVRVAIFRQFQIIDFLKNHQPLALKRVWCTTRWSLHSVALDTALKGPGDHKVGYYSYTVTENIHFTHFLNLVFFYNVVVTAVQPEQHL